jgi:hypothetical protein
MTGTTFVSIALKAVSDLLTGRAEELRAGAALEERKAAANTTLVCQHRFAANVIDDLKQQIELAATTIPTETEVEIPPPNPPGPGFTDCPPGCLHSESGPAPEVDMPSPYSPELLEYDPGDGEPDITPPTEEN